MKAFCTSKLAIAILLFVVCSLCATAQHHVANDKPAVHGMVIFGKEKVYAYHLPMFHSPHNYQVILEIQFDKQTMLDLRRDQELNPEHATYTIEPEKFVLPEMISQPRPFKVNIYRGHFERGGVKVFSEVTTQIVEVLYANMLDPLAEKSETLKYLLFGNSREQYAVHLLTNKPDFDQLLRVSFDPSLVGNSKYILVDFPSLENRVPGVSGNALNAFMTDRPIKMIFLKQIYLEFDDLY